MFGSLKKKLQEAISKAKEKIVERPEEKKETKPATKAAEEIKQRAEEIQAEEIVKEDLSPEMPEAEEFGETLAEEKEEEEFVEKLEEEKLPEPMRELETKVPELPKPTEEKKPEKRGISGLFARVTEKDLGEDEIDTILSELKKAMLANDVAFEVSERIADDVKNQLVGRRVKRSNVEAQIREALRNAIRNAMSQEKIDLRERIENSEVFTIVFLGFNGVGKTTTLAKFAHRFKKYMPIIAAGDTFRAASIEQLSEHADRIGVKLIKHNYGSDSAAVLFDAVKHARASGSRLVLADTAGRSHSNVNLMDELKKVMRVNKPDLKVLVLDALAGNDIYEQAKQFDDAVGVDAIVLTKADVYEKGGAALSAAYTIKKPILFLGTGQEYDDLLEFDADKIADSMIG